MQGIDYFNVIGGASNGFELLFFFEEALNVTKADGSVILEEAYSGTLSRRNLKRLWAT